MKTLKTIAILTLLSFAAFAGRSFQDSQTATLNTPAVKNYLNQGFNLNSFSEDMIYYIMAPTGDYHYSNTSCVMNKRTGGDFSLETTYATVNCEITASTAKSGKKTFSARVVDVTESVVY